MTSKTTDHSYVLLGAGVMAALLLLAASAWAASGPAAGLLAFALVFAALGIKIHTRERVASSVFLGLSAILLAGSVWAGFGAAFGLAALAVSAFAVGLISHYALNRDKRAEGEE